MDSVYALSRIFKSGQQWSNSVPFIVSVLPLTIMGADKPMLCALKNPILLQLLAPLELHQCRKLLTIFSSVDNAVHSICLFSQVKMVV